MKFIALFLFVLFASISIFVAANYRDGRNYGELEVTLLLIDKQKIKSVEVFGITPWETRFKFVKTARDTFAAPARRAVSGIAITGLESENLEQSQVYITTGQKNGQFKPVEVLSDTKNTVGEEVASELVLKLANTKKSFFKTANRSANWLGDSNLLFPSAYAGIAIALIAALSMFTAKWIATTNCSVSSGILFSIFATLVLSICSIYFWGLYSLGVKTDIPSHIDMAIGLRQGNFFPPTFLYFATLLFASGLSEREEILSIAAIFILTMSNVFKYLASVWLACMAIGEKAFKEPEKRCLIGIGAFLLAFSFAVPLNFFESRFMYVGNYPTNVWHNSTTIFLFPFALALYAVSYSHLFTTKTSSRQIAIMAILVLVNIAAKPSYFLVFAIIYPSFCLYKFGFTSKSLLSMLPVCVGVLALVLQHYMIYIRDFGNIFNEKSSVVLKFPVAFNPGTTNFLLPFVGSFLIPISFVLAFPRLAFFSDAFRYSFCQMVVAISIYLFVAESGPRANDGNFFWQTVVCNYILCLVVFSILVREKPQDAESARNYANRAIAPYAAIVLAFLSGIAYLVKTLYTGSYS